MEKALHNDELVIGKLYIVGFRLLQVLPPYLTNNNLLTFLSCGVTFNRQTIFVLNCRSKMLYGERINLVFQLSDIFSIFQIEIN